jgi:hypothetical protein
MKYLRLVLSLTVFALFSHVTVSLAESYDSDQATIKKGGAKTAKVMLGSKTYSAPISFGDGASWDSVKDHYEVSPDIASEIKEGEVVISIEADGGASFRVIEHKSEPKAASKPAKKK